MAEKKLLGLGEKKLVGKPTKEKTRAGRTVYETEEGKRVSEISRTIPIGDKWYNVPSIYAGKEYTEDELKTAIENNRIIPTSVHNNKEDAIKSAIKRSNELYKGGTPMMNKQMKLFEEGGLNQEGGMIDAESGNEVPVGSTREEVRDDIPAKLSEGEFVMPADVVRYHGLDKMMALRDEAKMGLRKMEAMGQMGNSDEATLPEEMPFGMADLIVVAEDGKEVEMAEGGYVTMANGGDPSANVRQLGATYTPPTNQPINFTRVMGDGGISFKEFRNAEGKNILVSYVGGVPLYPIPEGYSEYTPVAGEPITPIQEVVEASPPLPQEDEGARDRFGNRYDGSYQLDMSTATNAQLAEETKRQNSIFAKMASGIAFVAGGPAVSAVYEFGKSSSANKLTAELERRLENGLIDPANAAQVRADIAALKDNYGYGIVGTLAKYANKGVDALSEFLGIDLKKYPAVSKALNKLPSDVSLDNQQADFTANKKQITRGPDGLDSRVTDYIADRRREQSLSTPQGTDAQAAYLKGEAAGTNLRTSSSQFPEGYVRDLEKRGNLGGIQPESRADITAKPITGGIQPESRADITARPITGGIQPESRADITPAVSGAGGQVSDATSAIIGGMKSVQPLTGTETQLASNKETYNRLMAEQKARNDARTRLINQPGMTNYDDVYQQQVKSGDTLNTNQISSTTGDPFMARFPEARILRGGETGKEFDLGTSTVDQPPTSLMQSLMPPVTTKPILEYDDPEELRDAATYRDPRGPDQIPTSTKPFTPPPVMFGDDPVIDPRFVESLPTTNKLLPAPAGDAGMGGAIQDQQRRRESTFGQMTTPKFDPSSTVGQMTTPKLDPSSIPLRGADVIGTTSKTADQMGRINEPLASGLSVPPAPAVAARPTAVDYRDARDKGNLVSGVPLTARGNKTYGGDRVYDISVGNNTADGFGRAQLNNDIKFAAATGKAPPVYILSSGREVPADSAIAADDRDNIQTGYTGTDAEKNVTGKISGVDGLAGVVKSGVGNKAAKADGKTVYKDSSGKAYTRSTFGNKVEVKQNADGSWSNKTDAKGEPVKYSKGKGVTSGHGTKSEQDNSDEKEDSKIICTAMNASYGFGSYRQAIWLNYSNKHLTKAHELGYHTLFLPLVHLAYTKNNKFIRKILEHGTRRRTADLRAELKGTKRNTLGRIYRSIFEPLCYGVGKIKMAFGE